MGTGVLEGRVVGLVEERLKQVQAPVNLRLWDGQLIRAQQQAPVTLTIKSPQALTRLASPSLGQLAKSYVEGDIDLEGNFRDVLQAGEQFVSGRHGVYSPRRDRWRWWRHSRSSDRRNI
jgi:cyclopropane-fatty-acyl-phospholipid synthase